jgi:drug/metabolite transporter (DMT)-like permease
MVGRGGATQTRRMNISFDLGILFALFCAFFTNLAFLYKHRGAAAAPRVDIRHPLASAAGLFRSKWFAIGWLVAAGAWVFHVLALALAPLSVVQVVLAAGLVLLAVMADRMFGFTIGRRQWAGLTAMALGLGLIAVTQPAVHGAHSSYSAGAMAGFEGGLLLLGALLIIGPRLLGLRAKGQGQALGAASGLLFGVSDVAVKGLTGLLGDHGLLGLASPWLLVAAVASVTAFYASARALQDGEAVPVIAIMGTAANIVGIAGGIVVFGDPMPGDTLCVVLQAVGFLLIVVAAALSPAPVRAARIESAPEPRPAAPCDRRAGGRQAARSGYIRPVRGIDTSGRPVEVRG